MRTRKGRKVKYLKLSDKKQIKGIVFAPNVYPEFGSVPRLISETNRIKRQLELIASATGRRW